MRKIKFAFGSVMLDAELLQTPTAEAIWKSLPIEGEASRWGDEVYFEIPAAVGREEGARAVVEAGEIAYWPDGRAIAIGFGRTPISGPGEIRLASPCNIWAKAIGDVKRLGAVKAGTRVAVSAGKGWPHPRPLAGQGDPLAPAPRLLIRPSPRRPVRYSHILNRHTDPFPSLLGKAARKRQGPLLSPVIGL
jgi:hypothetical protein